MRIFTTIETIVGFYFFVLFFIISIGPRVFMFDGSTSGSYLSFTSLLYKVFNYSSSGLIPAC